MYTNAYTSLFASFHADYGATVKLSNALAPRVLRNFKRETCFGFNVQARTGVLVRSHL